MRIIIAICVAAVFSFGCMPEKKAAVVKPQGNSAKTQQMLAEQAQAEMEADIKSGTPSLKEPVFTKPVQKEQEPQAVLPAKKVTTLGSLKPTTKYPIKDGYPQWFYTPVYDGYIGAVGIAAKQSNGSITAQKKIAKMQAQKNLAKQIEVLVNTEVNVEATNVDRATVKYYQEKISTLTKESADQFLSGFKIQDEWIDDNTGEYYIWMVLEK